MTAPEQTYPAQIYAARLEIDYPESLNRVTTAFRIILIIPIAIVAEHLVRDRGLYGDRRHRSPVQIVSQASRTGGGIAGALFLATLLMILFRQRYPRWWFDFALQFNRFLARVGAYAALLTDRYPSTVEEQSVHLDLDYPDARADLNRWLPLVKWLLVIPHIVVLAFLGIGAVRRDRHRLVRDLVHRTLSAPAVRLCRGCEPLGAPGQCVLDAADHRPLPTLPSELIGVVHVLCAGRHHAQRRYCAGR